ncbi:fibronectin-like isoform X2 [Pecten maximus]|nr:fibronectin-like isoform X2 [Pecten maximus]
MEVDGWTKSSVIIERLTPGVHYSFCVISIVTVEDGLEIKRSSETISIITRPSPPDSMTAHRIHVLGERSVELSWEALTGQVDGYSVVLKDCMEDVVAEETTESPHLSISLGNHRISAAYFVEIRSLSHGERSDPLTEILQVEEIDLRIEELHATKQDTKSVTLKWKHPVYGPADSYVVQWALEHSHQFNVIDTVDSDRTGISVTGLTPGKAYKFRVASVFLDMMECGLETRVLSQDISVTTKPLGPDSISWYTINIEHAMLEWKAPRGQVDGYSVVLKDCMEDVVAEETTESPHLSISLGNHRISAAYFVEIRSLSHGERSDPLTEILQVEEIDLRIEELHATKQDTKSVTLKWKHPVYGPADSYVVQWALEHSHQFNVIDTVDSDRTGISVTGLTPGKAYKFRVASVFLDMMECGLETRVLSQDISVTTKPLSPDSLSSYRIENGHAKLKWRAPRGQVDGYSVVLKDCMEDVVAEETTESPHLFISLGNHRISAAYFVEIRSLSHGERSDPLTEILQVEAPSMPGEVDRIASTIKSTSFDLKWRASGGRVDKYIVKISDYSTFGAEYETEGPSPSLRIENLEVNTRYKLAIFAVRDNIKSEPRTENLKTKDIKVHWGCMTKAILTGGIAIVGVSAIAPFLGAVGFGAAGIGKGTMAASWMSSYGGAVASGGLFSTLQSLGVVGLGASAKAAIIASGMALGCIVEVI